jgi:hypothetical protein
MASDDKEHSKSTITLSKIRPLHSISDWKKWHSGIQEWGVDQDLDVEAPTAPAQGESEGAAAAFDVAQEKYQTKIAAYNRKHVKAANSVKFTCNDRGKDIIDKLPKEGLRFQSVVDALAAEFKPTKAAYLTEIESKWENLCLAGCKDLDDYTKQFNDLRAELKALENDLPTHSLITKFVVGLGQAYAGWHQNFELTRTLNGVEPTLANVLNSAKAEETRMNREVGATRALTASGPYRGRSRSPGRHRSYRERDHADGAKKGERGYRGRKIWCKECGWTYHKEADCFILHPEKKEQ